MIGLANVRDPFLINTVGHLIGLLLFSVLVVLLFVEWRRYGLRQAALPLAAAALSLLWNFGSLLVLAFSHLPGPSEWLVTFSFSVLSLLPAVLLHLVLLDRLKAVAAGGYVASAAAVFLHLYELIGRPSQFHQYALFVISIGFPILLGAALAITLRRDRIRSNTHNRLVGLGCLLAFTFSFIHFGYGHAASAWTAEVAWHHAGIPLVLIVLLQDYRFLLLDVFFRFLFNFGLAAGFTIVGFLLGERSGLWKNITHDEFWCGIGFVALCLWLIAFAYARRFVQRWLTVMVFHRLTPEMPASRIAARFASAQTEKQVMDVAATVFAECMRAQHVAVEAALKLGNLPSSEPMIAKTLRRRLPDAGHPWVEAIVPIRLSQGDSYYVLLGARPRGRRYLSEDVAVLKRLAEAVAEHMERFRQSALERLVREAEFRALQSQINPHFLFNALNTLYGTIDRTSVSARQLVLNLAEIFRYFLQSDRHLIAVQEELRIVRAYLEIEQLRLGNRLEVRWCVDEASMSTLIPVLSVQPLVENAVKHGVAAKPGKGAVRVVIQPEPAGVYIGVEDTGTGFEDGHPSKSREGAGVGLDNVRQRLRLCYGETAELNIRSTSNGSMVSFLVPKAGPTVSAKLFGRSSVNRERLASI